MLLIVIGGIGFLTWQDIRRNGLLCHIFGTFAAHGLDGTVKSSAEGSALGGMDNFIHRHDGLLLFSFDGRNCFNSLIVSFWGKKNIGK